MSDAANKILDAIELIANNAVDNADYDKTIQAQILSCEDQLKGKYRCKFQDSVFYAYTENKDTSFASGSYVYVSIPGNNMSNKKLILGSTKELGVNYLSAAEGDQAYDQIGINCVLSENKFYLNSNNKNYKYKIYDSNRNINEVVLDIQGLETYLIQSTNVILGATFKNSLPAERRYRGHFGITYNLVFKDNSTQEQVIRSYSIDEDNMVNNPYILRTPTRQYDIFPIDGQNFVKIDSIEIFNSDFPNAEGNIQTGKLNSGDIEISLLEITGAKRLSQEELNGVAITFFTPNGTFFNNSSIAGSSKIITAQIRVKGKLTSSNNIPFYWGIENVGITSNSNFYNKNLGRGWKCLNQKNVITGATETTEPVVEWLPSKDTFILTFEQATAKDNRIKVAILYEDTIVSKEINIQNLSNRVPEITIESDNGTEFYLDAGTSNLTCKVNNLEHLENNYRYFWGTVSNTGYFISLGETDDFNTQFHSYQNTINSYKQKTNPTQAETATYEAAIAALKGFEYIQRVQRNKIFNFQVNSITNFITIKCSVYKDGNYIGTGSIILTNSLSNPDGGYSLALENGSAVFKYNESGTAPNSKSLENPLQIKALSFTLYDNFGEIVDKNKLLRFAGTEIKWQVPIKNTLIQIPSGVNGEPDPIQGEYEQGEQPDTVFYSNIESLVYDISSKYNPKNLNNQIKLHLKYKNMNLIAYTQFLFIKEGEDGTNGTDYILRIIPNSVDNIIPPYPIITRYGNIGNVVEMNYNIGTVKNRFNINQSKELFKVQFWHNQELLWEGSSKYTGQSIDGQTTISDLKWQILKNKYSNDLEDYSILEVDENSANKNLFKVKATDFLNNSNYTNAIANIVKCTLTLENQETQQEFYATIPIALRYLVGTEYNFYLKENSGFNYVVYTQDGLSPQYNSTEPFTFFAEQKPIDEDPAYEEINIDEEKFNFNLIKCGQTKNRNTTTKQWNTIISKDLIISRKGESDAFNQFKVRPAAKYDGWCVNNGLICQAKINNTVIGRMFIPIHLYLNRFVFSHLNDWDGNSVQINDQGGYILSPQMGAGFKDSNNAFTGLLMGEVKDPNKGVSNTGLLAYDKGQRTIFLNSENGSAIFGKAGASQITIDPSINQALLYSGNFWKNYDQNTGLPTSYESTNYNKDQETGLGIGLLINLSKPEIRYGNGNFVVNENGYLTAKGGNIGDWVLKEKELTSQKGEDDDNNSSPEVHLVSDRKKIIITDTKGYWTGTINKKVTIPKGGCIYSGTHKYLSIPGYPIANNPNTDGSYNLYVTTGYALKDSDYNGFYLGHDGLSIGSKFKVTKDGKMYIGPGAVQFGGVHSYDTYQSYYINDGWGGSDIQSGRMPQYWVLNASNDKKTYLQCEDMYLYSDRLEFNFNDTDNGLRLNSSGIYYKSGDYINKQGIKLHIPRSTEDGFIQISAEKIEIYRFSNNETKGHFKLDLETGRMFYRGSNNYRYQEWGIKRNSEGYFEFYSKDP